MSWSWSNPSQEEAIEAYGYYKGKYNSSANQLRDSQRQEQGYRNEKSNAIAQRSALTSQKLNLEKRLEGVEKIIKMLEGSGGWFAANVPDTISKAQRSLSKTDESFRGSMKLSGGGGSASLETAFATKPVEADPNSAAALLALRSEKIRLEQQIADLQAQIANLSAAIDNLTSQINACNYTQASLKISMNGYAYDMNHYKKFTY